jgi:zinc/manganese transport system substrate-binding protein
MKYLLSKVICGICALAAASAQAKLNVVATTTDLAALAREVGGDATEVEAIARGTQDPHFIEAKPSFMTKVSRADLVVAMGLELEIGWLPSIVRGARNPKVLPGNKGYLEVGPGIPVLEKATGAVTRAEGDVHPDGNPHFNLDPLRMGTAAGLLAERLGELDAANAAGYRQRAAALKTRLEAKTKEWRERVAATGVKSVVTYHKTLTYFLDRFGLRGAAVLEPKPGIPPTAPHIVEVIELVKREHVPLILVENYFDPAPAQRVARDAPGTRVAIVPVAVDGAPGTGTTEALIEALVQAIEGKPAAAGRGR